MTENPEQIALDALAELGETPEPDAIAQLRAIANHDTALLNDMRERMHLTRQPPADVDEYTRLLHRSEVFLIANVRIHAAQESAQLEAILNLPDAAREPDEGTE